MTDFTPLTREQQFILMRDLNPSRIKQRKQGGRNLSYLEAYDVKATLTRIFGFGGFSANVVKTEIINARADEFKGSKGETKYKDTVSVMVTLELSIPQLQVTYTETAASSQSGSQGFGDVADFAIKTAAPDALKRCAIYLGTQFGLSLYNNGSTKEIINTIVAPGQEWWQGQAQKTEQTTPQAPAVDTPVPQDPQNIAETSMEDHQPQQPTQQPAQQQAQIDPNESEKRHQDEMRVLNEKLNRPQQ